MSMADNRQRTCLDFAKWHQWQWGRGVNEFPTKNCNMCLGICGRMTTPPISLFIHPHMSITRRCIFWNLRVLRNKLSAMVVKVMET